MKTLLGIGAFVWGIAGLTTLFMAFMSFELRSVEFQLAVIASSIQFCVSNIIGIRLGLTK